jgi:hypothetical protein
VDDFGTKNIILPSSHDATGNSNTLWGVDEMNSEGKSCVPKRHCFFGAGADPGLSLGLFADGTGSGVSSGFFATWSVVLGMRFIVIGSVLMLECIYLILFQFLMAR